MADGIGFEQDHDMYVATIRRADGYVEYAQTRFGFDWLEEIIKPMLVNGGIVIRMFKL